MASKEILDYLSRALNGETVDDNVNRFLNVDAPAFIGSLAIVGLSLSTKNDALFYTGVGLEALFLGESIHQAAVGMARRIREWRDHPERFIAT